MAIPVYLFAGFLESGKTTFIASVLMDPGFTPGDEKTLILLCEEGMEEFDPRMLEGTHSVVEVIDDEEDFAPETLRTLVSKHNPDRVIVEMNGMWDMDAAISRMPLDTMELFQIITTVNAETFELYAANMGPRMLQHIASADMVVFNRATDEMKAAIRDRNIRSMNPQAALYFENADGTSEDYGEGMPPPYDMDAPVINLEDRHYGIFYLDASEYPEEYAGKTVSFKAFIYKGKDLGADEYVPGRMAMVCCQDDLQFIGFIAKANGLPIPPQRTWQKVTALVKVEEREEYRGKGPVLYVTSVEPCAAPEEEIATFNG